MSGGTTGDEAGALVLVQQVMGDEVAVFGPDDAIEQLGRRTDPIPTGLVAAVGTAASAAGFAQEVATGLSGSYVRLTREAMKLLAQHGSSAAANGSFYGVVRSTGGQIAGHLTFVDPSTVTALTTSLPGLLSAAAMQLQQARIERKLDAIAENLDYLIVELTRFLGHGLLTCQAAREAA